MSVPSLTVDSLTPTLVGRALRESGGLMVHPSIDADLCARAVKAAHDFFAIPAQTKVAMAIAHSPHFRGWSEMHNERDWREQIHLGRECPAAGETPSYLRLEGPNLWPSDEAWRSVVTAYLDAVATLGETLLACIAADLGVAGSTFDGVGRSGYAVLKLIGYHPQGSAAVQRPGVAAHVDFSWLTLTQQDAPGLQIQDPDGNWKEVSPMPGGLWVHAGELLEFASCGVYRATPHRVVNPSLERTRVSLPFFLNPPLDGWVRPLMADAERPNSPVEISHVHRVLPPNTPSEPFHYGQAEWRRKGLNGWCHICAPPHGEADA